MNVRALASLRLKNNGGDPITRSQCIFMDPAQQSKLYKSNMLMCKQ